MTGDLDDGAHEHGCRVGDGPGEPCDCAATDWRAHAEGVEGRDVWDRAAARLREAREAGHEV